MREHGRNFKIPVGIGRRLSIQRSSQNDFLSHIARPIKLFIKKVDWLPAPICVPPALYTSSIDSDISIRPDTDAPIQNGSHEKME